MSSASPVARARENLVGIVSLVVTGVWMLGLFTGQEWWLPVLIVGYAFVLPVVAILFGDEEDVEEYWDGDATVSTTESSDRTDEEQSTADALDTLRDRYARGELTEEQFERKLDRLLETETVEDASEHRRRAEREREREREPERERE
ncbi:SHOCT domain-containing protein [Halobaculum sp. MBLA0143]|uniref:SHOCT domain-containing protein n=1 Tax=Halobaculum sp. MBLA0143 TaxID=3079933 RepID=UPI003524FCAD